MRGEVTDPCRHTHIVKHVQHVVASVLLMYIYTYFLINKHTFTRILERQFYPTRAGTAPVAAEQLKHVSHLSP